MPLAYDAAHRLPLRRTSIEIYGELFWACETADFQRVKLLAAELGPRFNPNAHTIRRFYAFFNPYPFEIPLHVTTRDLGVWDDAGAGRCFSLLLLPGLATQTTTARGDQRSEEEIHREWFQIAEFLLAKGADPNLACFNARHRYGDWRNKPGGIGREIRYNSVTPLCMAVKTSHVELVQLLLVAGADPNLAQKDDGAEAPIHSFRLEKLLCRESESTLIRIMNILLEAGADINARTGHRETLLVRCVHYLAKSDESHGRKNWIGRLFVKALLKTGIDVNLGDRAGMTALHYAVVDGRNPRLVKALLDAGANPNAAPAPQTQAERDAHLCSYLHPSIVRRYRKEWLPALSGFAWLKHSGQPTPYEWSEYARRNPERHNYLQWLEYQSYLGSYSRRDDVDCKIQERVNLVIPPGPYRTPLQLAEHIDSVVHDLYSTVRAAVDNGGDASFEQFDQTMVPRLVIANLVRKKNRWRKLRAASRLVLFFEREMEFRSRPENIDFEKHRNSAMEGMY